MPKNAHIRYEQAVPDWGSISDARDGRFTAWVKRTVGSSEDKGGETFTDPECQVLRRKGRHGVVA
jgi:hypothetical protein